MILARSAAAVLLLAIATGAAEAQQIYRWTDDKGRVHITDTPPPPTARGVKSRKAASAPASSAQQPFELEQAMKNFPVVLYTSPSCEAPCAMAREALNNRGVPFREVLVWDADTNEELKRVSGANEVPTLLVGRTAQRGFSQSAFDTLLDSARYPRAGILPRRSQAAPPIPAGYQPPGAPPVKAEPGVAQAAAQAPQAAEAPRGPYYAPEAAPAATESPEPPAAASESNSDQ
ncbi:MAG TPA: glutaredoxin family protein [Burkholderiales bacterium]|nr:glutaredoxin family protein [Burkholderiales bacterium]